MAQPSGPTSHLWPSAASASIWAARTSTGNAPNPWIASTRNIAPRRRQISPIAFRFERNPVKYWTEPSARGGRINPVQRIRRPQPLDSHALCLQPPPWILVRRELLFKGDYAISRAPIEPHGDGRDPFRGVFHEGNFSRLGVNKTRRGGPEAVVSLPPFARMK